MKQPLYILTFLLILICSKTSFGQGKEILQGNQSWLDYRLKIKANDKLTIKAYNSFRWKDLFGSQNKWLSRIAVSQRLEEGFSVGAGVTHGFNYEDKQINRQEIRPFQELSIKQNLYDRLIMKQRVRVEERFFRHKVDGNYLDEFSFNYRFRYRFAGTINLIKSKSGSLKKPMLSLTLGDEIFINAGEEVVENIFDQNRFFAFLQLRLLKNFSIRTSYASRFKSTSNPGTFKRTSIFSISLNQGFSL